jgi:hypothetical protein
MTGEDWFAPFARWMPFICLLLFAGCAHPGGGGGFDPLVGGTPLPRTGTGSGGSATAVASQGNGATGPAPLPVPSTTTSPAALAAGTNNPSLDPSRDLRIGTGAATPVANTDPWRGSAGATLRQPEPAPEGQPRTDAVPVIGGGQPAVTLTSTSGAADEYRQLQGQLQARGVTWQRLETWGANGEWKFSCSIPNPQNPNVRRTYEAIAQSDVAALRAALERIDSDRR